MLYVIFFASKRGEGGVHPKTYIYEIKFKKQWGILQLCISPSMNQASRTGLLAASKGL